MTPQRLYINIDHVATVRQARRTDEPDASLKVLVYSDDAAVRDQVRTGKEGRR